MSKNPIPFSTPDISAFARNVSQQLKKHDDQPSHLSLINMFARAAGFRNYQHMKAAHAAHARLESKPREENVDFRLVERTLQQFDHAGHLVRWPSRRPVQELCLWVMWSNIPPETPLTEKAVNALLNQAHLFGDAAILRRSLIGLALMTRARDGTNYRRVEKRPPAEALALIKKVGARRAAPVQHSASV